MQEPARYADADRYGDSGSYANPARRDSHAAPALPNRDTYPTTYRNAYGDGYTASYINAYASAYCHSHANAATYSNTTFHGYSYTSTYSNINAKPNPQAACHTRKL